MIKQTFSEHCSLCRGVLPFSDHKQTVCENGHLWLRYTAPPSRLRLNKELLLFPRTPLLLSDKRLRSQSCCLLVSWSTKSQAASEKSAAVSRTSPSSLLACTEAVSNAFLLMSSRCVLSHQACQSLTFRRCLLLDSVAKLPEPAGKRPIFHLSGLFQSPRRLAAPGILETVPP